MLSRSLYSIIHITSFIILFFNGVVLSAISQEGDIDRTIKAAIHHQNLGLAYLEESQPTKAAAEFSALVELLPDEAIGYGNIAVAHLRLQQNDIAEEWIKLGIDAVPMDSQLHFILSEVYQVQGESSKAIEALKEAVRLSPDELEFRYKLTRYYLGQRNNPEAQQEAVHHLQELYARSPVNVVIIMKLAQALIGQDRLEDAEKHCQELLILLGDTDADKLALLTKGIDAIKNRNQNDASRNIRFFENVHRASPRYQQGIGELVTDILGHPIEIFSPGFKARLTAKKSPPINVEFVDITEQLGLVNHQGDKKDHASISLFDYDNDGKLDIYSTSTGLLRNSDDGKFLLAPYFQDFVVPPSLNLPIHTYLDLDKDGTQELLLQTQDGITLLRRDSDRKWGASPIIMHQRETDNTSVLLTVDYDHDGDLDLFAGRSGVKMYRNNGDARFIDVSDQTFLTNNEINDTQPMQILTDAIAADFDDDGDIDIFAGHSDTGCTLYDNLRQGKLRAVTDIMGISQEVHYTSAAVGDYDNDGDSDLFLASTTGLRLYRNRGDATFVADIQSKQTFEKYNDQSTILKSLDYDNDGFLDLWIISKQGLFLYRNDGTCRFTETSSIIKPITPMDKGIAGAVGDYDNDGDLDLFYINEKGQLRALQNNGGNQNNWIQVKLEGITTGNNKVNRDGFGSKLEVKVRDLYQLQYVSQQIAHFGLGTYDTADVVRVVWTNGVPQNVIEPKAKQRIQEKQILKGSCPFLYVYDGEKYEFVTDLLWRAPLGLVTAMGFVAPDETRDFIKISSSQIQPKSGRYSIQITEELWETAYFDMVKLIAVDHPADMDIFVNEQYTPPPFAEFKIYGVSEKLYPKSATDHRGNDVSAALKKSDYQYAVEHEPGPYQGVVESHAIILDLGDVPDDKPVTLYLHGWIFPTDTSINVALSQNPAINPRFPSVAVKDKIGQWKTVIDMIGIPAGKNKTITIDLTGKFLSDDRHVRIETDMQIYWDAAFFTVGAQDVPMEITEMNPDSADLHYRGFSEMSRPNPHAPHLFDYQKVTKAGQWRDLEGFYTRYGDVNPLLQEVDDMYVILNAGDEITVEFDASRLPVLKDGWTRDFILYSDGWDKDGDINTLTSQTVEPLPFHGMSKYPYPETEHYPDDEAHKRYRLEYNTRRVTHKLPVLQQK